MNEKSYADIIGLSRPISRKHPKMAIRDRAAQFSPFAALVGYEDAVRETRRVTDSRLEADEDRKEILNQKLTYLIKNGLASAGFTYFIPDLRKSGGRYEKISGRVKKYSSTEGVIILDTGEKLTVDRIFDIEIPELSELSEWSLDGDMTDIPESETDFAVYTSDFFDETESESDSDEEMKEQENTEEAEEEEKLWLE